MVPHGFYYYFPSIFLNIYWLKYSQEQINELYIRQQTMKNNGYNREDTMNKNINTYIYDTNETFISIFMDIRLGYIVYYHIMAMLIRDEN